MQLYIQAEKIVSALFYFFVFLFWSWSSVYKHVSFLAVLFLSFFRIFRHLCILSDVIVQDAVLSAVRVLLLLCGYSFVRVSLRRSGSCRIVSDLDFMNTPVSPDVGKYTAVAAFAGFLLAMAYALYRVLSRSFIVTEKDVSENLELPVLGVIPIF